MNKVRQPIVRRIVPEVDWASARAVRTLLDYIAPDDIEPRHKTYMVSGPLYARHLVVTGFPATVRFGYLLDLFTGQPGVNVVQVIAPLADAEAQQQLGRSRRAARATIAEARDAPAAEVGLSDVERLRLKVARGEERLVHYGIYIQITALSPEELETRTATVAAQLRALGLEAKRTSFRQKQAFDSCLPLGLDLLQTPNLVDTSTVAQGFFTASSSLTTASAGRPIFYGLTVDRGGNTGGQVLYNPFDPTLTNPHTAVLAKPGAGKSYLLKYELLQNLIFGRRYFVIDPEHEYETLAQAVGGTFVRLAPGSGARVNPMDLPRENAARGENDEPELAEPERDVLAEKIATLTGWLETVLAPGPLAPAERGALEEALRATYAGRGITPDPATQAQEPPLLEELGPHLAARLPGLAPALAGRLGGTLAMFNGRTNVDLTAPLVVFGVRDVSLALEAGPELLSLAASLVFDRVWTYARSRSDPAGDPITVLLDEGWTMIESGAGGTQLARTARRGRKYNVRLVVATQRVGDVLESAVGRTVLAACNARFLLEMEHSEVDLARQTFQLSPGEVEFLEGCTRTDEYSDCLLLLGKQRTGLRVLRAPTLIHRLITTRPGEWGRRQL